MNYWYRKSGSLYAVCKVPVGHMVDLTVGMRMGCDIYGVS